MDLDAAAIALLGVLTGGVLVVIGQVVADRRLEQRLKRAVLAEIRQNATSLDVIYAMAKDTDPLPRLRNDAWIAGHGVSWPEQSFRALAAFYYFVEWYQRLAEVIAARELQSGAIEKKLRGEAAAAAGSALECVKGAEGAAR